MVEESQHCLPLVGIGQISFKIPVIAWLYITRARFLGALRIVSPNPRLKQASATC